MLRLRCWCLSFLLLLFGCGEEAGRCGVCERQRHPDMGAELTLASGQRLSTCCVSCALHFSEKLETPARQLKVEDHAGGGLMDSASAYFVEGSRLNPCMLPPPREEGTRTPLRLSYDRCAPGMIAFRQEQDARAFVARHGGTLQLPGHVSSSVSLHR